MTNQMNLSDLEKDLEALYTDVPISETFIGSLKFQLNCRVNQFSAKTRRPLKLRPAWMVALGLFVVLLSTTLIIGPQKVYAEMRRLLGYIPGVGIVNTQTPIRVLSAPVEQTRYGVTVSVTSAILTADRTQITYRVFGVPRSAYPSVEEVTGCIEAPYLLLADGAQIPYSDEMQPVPGSVNQATFVIPCIVNTLPGSAPEDWRIPLEFVPAPPDLTVMPVIEITPTIPSTPEPSAEELLSPTPVDNSVTVTRFIETENGYILLGEFTPAEAGTGFVQTIGLPVFTDANGVDVPINYPVDVNSFDLGSDGWVFEFNAIGVAFPLTIAYRGEVITQPDPQAQIELPFDFGQSTLVQEWHPDTQFELAGQALTLADISADSRGGYTFHFKTGQDVYGLRVQVKDYSPSGSGGGGGGLSNGDLYTSLSFTQPLSGPVTLVISNLSLISKGMTWQTTWAPGMERTDLPAAHELPDGTCGDVRTLQSVPALDGNLSGRVLLYQQLPDADAWGLVISDLDGANREIVEINSGWGALSVDGQQVVYAVENGFEFLTIESKGVVNLSNGTNGYNPVWSHDGTRFAFVRGASEGVSVMDVATGVAIPVSSLGWESVVGWLPDDSRLIIAAMYSGGVARQIRAVDPQTGEYEELFEINDASAKSLSAALSPDGQWLAYRGSDNSSVRIIKMDGSQERLLLDHPSVATSGIVWSGSGWLGVSLAQSNGQNESMILVNPETCEIYQVPGVSGTLEGLFIQ